ncbi:stage V sporulation protein B [Clostridium sp. CAG:914]|nr:stage V sporulation protein B [Clostridium sp. CAG:914]
MKNKFIKSTIILIIGGGITKLLAMVIKIALARSIGNDGIGIYMMILPTFNLFITLSTLSLSTSLGKLIAEKRSSKKVIFSSIPFTMIYNFFLMIILIFLSKFISNTLLNNSITYYPILCISFTLPIIALSGILKGYFFGKNNMFPYTFENICEQIVRLLFIIFIVPKLLNISLIVAISSLVLVNILSEGIAIIVMLLFIPNKSLDKESFKVDKNIVKDVLNISIPSTGSRLIGSISYFLEPIILTYAMLKSGSSLSLITSEYGIVTGYVYALLLIPSFFTMAISTSLLPIISKNYAERNMRIVKKGLSQGMLFSLLIGCFFTMLFMLFSNYILKFIYNTTLGSDYVRLIAPFFIFHYIQGPLTTYLQAINKAKCAMYGTLLGSIIKNILLFVLAICNYKIWSLIISTIVNILIVTIHHIIYTIKSFRNIS